MTTRQKIQSVVALAIVLFIAFTWYSFNRELNRPRLPILSQVHAFSLVDSNGKAFTPQQVEGRVWIAHFFFTTCGDVCPLTAKNMASLNRSFELVKNIALVSITVNPEQDTPEALQKYADKLAAGKNWYFVTGSREEITDLAVKSFKLGDIKEPVFHSTYLALVDRHGLIRGYYDGLKQEEVNRLFSDAAKLIKEKS